jgi:DNA-binding SARP family transcriptional activator
VGGEAGTAAADDAAAAALLVPALERVEPGPGPRSGSEGGGTLRGRSALEALFERGLLDLLRRRPALAGELGRRRDLPPAWRRWLAGLPPAALASESSGYAVELLGKPSLRLRRPGGRSLELRFPLRRAFQVFAYLASSPGFEATRDELEEAVWLDEDEAAVAKNLHPTLSYVRRTLEGGGETAVTPVVLRRGVYRLNPRLGWNVDVVELVRRAEEGRRRLGEGQPEQALSLWQGAWALYRGPFLAGWEAPWIAARRDRFTALHLDLLSSLGEVCERLDRLTEAMDAYRSALIEDPLQERVHLALMRIYARQGRRDLVRRQYERLTALLREDLGVEPLAETTDAYQRLMA